MNELQFRLLKPDEIDCRIGQVTKKGITLLLYKNARCDMNILDETVGADRWQRKHYDVKGNLYCSVGIKTGNEWVWKDDCGTESNTEKEKGEASDSFKRACVNWGIGRELYTAPFIFVAVPTEEYTANGKTYYRISSQYKYITYKVDDIQYTNKTITGLTISDGKGVVVFTTKKTTHKLENKPQPSGEMDWSKPVGSVCDECGREIKGISVNGKRLHSGKEVAEITKQEYHVTLCAKCAQSRGHVWQ